MLPSDYRLVTREWGDHPRGLPTRIPDVAPEHAIGSSDLAWLLRSGTPT